MCTTCDISEIVNSDKYASVVHVHMLSSNIWTYSKYLRCADDYRWVYDVVSKSKVSDFYINFTPLKLESYKEYCKIFELVEREYPGFHYLNKKSSSCDYFDSEWGIWQGSKIGSVQAWLDFMPYLARDTPSPLSAYRVDT